MTNDLTNDSQALICVLYKSYFDEIKSGADKWQAKNFGSSDDIKAKLMPKWSAEDTAETCRELERAGYLDIKHADNRPYFVTISDAGIIYMENKFPNGISQVLDFLAKIKSIVPFI